MMLLLQVNSYIERHDMFSGRKYRGDLCLLRFFVSMTINATSLLCKYEWGLDEGREMVLVRMEYDCAFMSVIDQCVFNWGFSSEAASGCCFKSTT